MATGFLNPLLNRIRARGVIAPPVRPRAGFLSGYGPPPELPDEDKPPPLDEKTLGLLLAGQVKRKEPRAFSERVTAPYAPGLSRKAETSRLRAKLLSDTGM